MLQPGAFAGNTSACAEKRHTPYRHPSHPWKYLRVRGEEHFMMMFAARVWEIPPRARRRDGDKWRVAHGLGNTSACAEKRQRCALERGEAWKYLRVRGEEGGLP